MCMHAQSCLTLCELMAGQAPLSMEFSRQKYWSGFPFPSPGDIPHPGVEPMPVASPALVERFFTIAPSGKPLKNKVKLKPLAWTLACLNACAPQNSHIE